MRHNIIGYIIGLIKCLIMFDKQYILTFMSLFTFFDLIQSMLINMAIMRTNNTLLLNGFLNPYHNYWISLILTIVIFIIYNKCKKKFAVFHKYRNAFYIIGILLTLYIIVKGFFIMIGGLTWISIIILYLLSADKHHRIVKNSY